MPRFLQAARRETCPHVKVSHAVIDPRLKKESHYVLRRTGGKGRIV